MSGFVLGECQPCERYTAPTWDPFGERHECFAPFGEEVRTVHCLGTVRFCGNCHADHHSGGYQTCAGITSCPRNHVECLAAIAARVTT